MARFKKKKIRKKKKEKHDRQTRRANKSLNSPSRPLMARRKLNKFLLKLPSKANLILGLLHLTPQPLHSTFISKTREDNS